MHLVNLCDDSLTSTFMAGLLNNSLKPFNIFELIFVLCVDVLVLYFNKGYFCNNVVPSFIFF